MIFESPQLWAIAGPMAFATAWVARKAADARTRVDNAYAVFLLVMMASMFGGAAIYLLNPTVVGIVEAFGMNMAVMTVGVLFVLKYWVEVAGSWEDVIETENHDSTSNNDAQALERVAHITHGYVTFFVAMFASMIAIALIYIVNSTATGLEVAIGAGMTIMATGVLLILRYSSKLGGNSKQEPIITFRLNKSSLLRGTIVSLILLNEFLMGWVFVMASSKIGSIGATIPNALTATFGYVVSSYWFIFMMTLEMAFTIYMFRKDVPKSFIVVLAFQTAIMLFSPTALSNHSWGTTSIYIGSALMTLLFVFFYEYLFRNKVIGSTMSRYFMILLMTYGLMMAGLFIWILNGDSLLFALSIIIEMALYFNTILDPSKFKDQQMKSWISNPMWVFGFLLATFVAEFFMGGLIDVSYYGQGFVSGIQFASITTGSILLDLSASLYNFFSFFTAITGSAWYLIMMGAEMGALVVFKIRQVRELETRIRLGLVVVTYAVYAVYFPYFFFPSSSALAKAPLVGWSMGIGTSGALAPAFIVSIGLTYLISGALALLFGGRQVCSLFCTAALMYQGTFPDSLKTFNRTSKLGGKLLTSRMSSVYKVVSSLVIASLIGASAVSYLNSVHVLSFTIYGEDIAILLYAFYFNFLWYLIFLAMPFIGTYGCVTTGMCHWGMFNQFVGRLGFFKLKVRDPNVCARCPTKDCARACPVGLTDLPSKFIASGEFKSHKCIGVGDCVSSCPYQNEYFYDVRHWFKGKLGRSETANRTTQLPVLNYKKQQSRSHVENEIHDS